jgi:hypothetical protein
MSETVICKQCGVSNDQQAKCDGCDEMIPHDQLIHYDGGVFCKPCDKFVEEEEDTKAKNMVIKFTEVNCLYAVTCARTTDKY